MPLPTVGRKGLPAEACQTSMSFESMGFGWLASVGWLLGWLAGWSGWWMVSGRSSEYFAMWCCRQEVSCGSSRGRIEACSFCWH